VPVTITRNSSAWVSLRLSDGTASSITVEVRGSGLRIDRDTGELTAGRVASVTLAQNEGTGRHLRQVSAEMWSDIRLSVDNIADLTGERLWSHPKHLPDLRDVLARLHENIVITDIRDGRASITGSDGDNRLAGRNGDDVLRGMAGNDRITGAGGDDSLYGADGNDRLLGGAGNDLLQDLHGRNHLTGGRGKDLLLGGDGHDTLRGGDDADILAAGRGTNMLHGGRGEDMFVFDFKTPHRTTIADFSIRDDRLHLVTDEGSASVAYVVFTQRAEQVGRNVVYDDGYGQVVLRDVDLRDITRDHFVDGFFTP
jgi:Ca2+-binding RTX toxin-like protein